MLKNQRIGKALFESQHNQTLDDQKTFILQKSEWWLNNGIYMKNGWQSIFETMITAQINSLYLYHNNLPNILFQIIHINFVQLTYISLECNQIVNIQVLSLGYFPQLQTLGLRNNLITNISSLRKINTPQLKKLWIYNNLIKQVEVINEIDADIQSLHIQFSIYQNVIGENLTSFVKLRSLSRLIIQSHQRIKQLPVQQMLKCKNGQIWIED